jgi:hypothetical protein
MSASASSGEAAAAAAGVKKVAIDIISDTV